MLVETIELEGHILDSLTLSKILDHILGRGCSYELLDLDVGRRGEDMSRAKLFVSADDREVLRELTAFITAQGGVICPRRSVALEPAPVDGVFPEGFYATTNLKTFITLDGEDIVVEGEVMDVAIAVEPDRPRARGVAMDQVKKGELIVVGNDGVRVEPLALPRGSRRGSFGFMQSEVSVEKPRGQVLGELAETLLAAKRKGGRILLVLGPAVVHSDAVDACANLIRRGYVDVLFGGNAVAVHDIERALYGTSLGVDRVNGRPVPGGNQHHLRAINRIRSVGGMAVAVREGILTEGIMYTAIRAGVDMVLAGSIRDDGPLPEVITDALEAKRRMREMIHGVDVALLVATALHSIAAGNLLPARVATYCVDINPGTVTKLMDRGSSQAVPVVMDCESFFREMDEMLP